MQLDRMTFPFLFGSSTQPQPAPSTTNQQKIDFTAVLQAYLQMLTGTGGSVFYATWLVANYCQRTLLATQIIFHRLIHAPTFDPTSALFKEQIDQLEKQVPLLQAEIEKLEQRFWQNHLISRDMKHLRQLHNDISKPLTRLNRYVNILEQRKHRFPIQDQLEQVRDSFQKLDEQLDDYCLNNGESIVDQFKKAVEIFTQGNMDLPKDITKQLVETWKDLDEPMKRLRRLLHIPQAHKVCGKVSDLMRDTMQGLEKQAGMETTPTNFEHPLKLRNIGNSCYMDSVLQACLCLEPIREKLREPLIRDPKNPNEYQKKLAIQQEILQFIDSQPRNQNDGKPLTQMEFILLLLGGPSLHRLRDAIFRSGLHPEFDMLSLTRQMDASSVAELFVDQLLTTEDEDHEIDSACKFKWQEHWTTPAFPGLEFTVQEELQSGIQIPLRTLSRYHKLDKLVHTVLGPQVCRNPRLCDPSEGEVIKGKEKQAAAVQDANPTNVDEHHKFYKLRELPSTLYIQFKRFLNQETDPRKPPRLVKDNRPVVLPPDGILDLSDYYDPSEEDAPKEARYKIKSMVIHTTPGRSIQNGHYIALVEINGKYYECDDLDRKGYREIAKKDFFGHKDPYLLFLERIPSDEEIPEKA